MGLNAVLYALTVLVWGTSWLPVKLHLGVVAPEVSVAYRFILAAALTFAICLVTRRPMRFSSRDQAFMALQGLFLFSTNYCLIYLASQYLTSGLVAVAFSMVIVFNIFGGAVLFRSAIEPRMLLGALCGIGGLALVFRPEIAAFDLNAEGARGLLLAIAGTVSASCGMLTSAWNQRMRALPVFQTNAYGMAYGTALTVGFCFANDSVFNFDPTPLYVGSLVFLAIFATVVGFWTYLTLVGRIGAGRAAYATATFPLVALALSTAFESYVWSAEAAAGVALVLLGNIAILMKPKTS